MDSNQLTNSNNDHSHSNALLLVDSHKWILDGAGLEPTWVQAHKHIPSEPDLSLNLLLCVTSFSSLTQRLFLVAQNSVPGRSPIHTLLAPGPERKTPFLETILIGLTRLTSLRRPITETRWIGVLYWPGLVISSPLCRLGLLPSASAGPGQPVSSASTHEALAVCPDTRGRGG